MMKCMLLAGCLIGFTILTGCSTTKPFNKIPTELSSFKEPESKLVQQYPDIERYEKTFRGFHPNFPLAQDLVHAWGEPDAKSHKWSDPLLSDGIVIGAGVLSGSIPLIAAGAMLVMARPYVPEVYFWKKGNYCIEATLDERINNGYRKTINYWEWYEVESKEKMPGECKKLIAGRTVKKAKLIK